ncbi:MAG: mucoidy inhibitor MuiA family protein [Alphaproteobacteria bacterium]
MHRSFYSLGLFALCTLTAAPTLAKDIPADLTLKAATVYTDRARLTDVSELEVPAGKHVIIFENLPAALAPDSLRVEGKGTADATLGALSHKIINNAELISGREKTLNDQIETLQNQRRVIEAEKTALGAKRTFLNSLQAQAAAKTKEEIAEFNLETGQWLAAAQTIETGTAESLKADIEKDLQIQSLDKQITKLRQDLSQLHTGRKSSYEVRLPVEIVRAGTLKIDLSYQLSGATWRPVYDARLDTKTGALQITQYGAVTQNTGEDWTNIALTLSTARPHRGASPPPLSPMWVNIHSAPKLQELGFESRDSAAQNTSLPVPITPPLGSVSMPEDMDGEEDPLQRWRRLQEEREVQQNTATINNEGFTAEYVIPGPSSVPADGTESKLLIGNFETENEIQTHVKPQISDNAFLVAKTTLKGETPILPGTISLFRDGAYVGQSALPLLRPGKDYNLFFGIDDRIEVARETLKAENSESGIILRDNVKEQRYITTLRNLHKEPVKLVLSESTPVPQNEKISVKILEKHTTPGYVQDIHNKKGVLQWTQTIPPGDKTEIKLGWTVSWPKDQPITGLP